MIANEELLKRRRGDVNSLEPILRETPSETDHRISILELKLHKIRLARENEERTIFTLLDELKWSNQKGKRASAVKLCDEYLQKQSSFKNQYFRAMLMKERGVALMGMDPPENDDAKIWLEQAISVFDKQWKIAKKKKPADNKLFQDFLLDFVHLCQDIAFLSHRMERIDFEIWHGLKAVEVIAECEVTDDARSLDKRVSFSLIQSLLNEKDYYKSVEVTRNFLKRHVSKKNYGEDVEDVINEIATYNFLNISYDGLGDLRKGCEVSMKCLKAIGTYEIRLVRNGLKEGNDPEEIRNTLIEPLKKRREALFFLTTHYHHRKMKQQYRMVAKECLKCAKLLNSGQEENIFSVFDQEIKKMKKDYTFDCATCDEKANKRCPNCKLSYFCSAKCQRKNWNHHKEFCVNIFERPKVKDFDWKDFGYPQIPKFAIFPGKNTPGNSEFLKDMQKAFSDFSKMT